MELKDKLVSAFMAFENQVDLDHPVHDVRSAAMKVFENQGFPTKKMEAWKYTSLKSLEKLDFNIFPKEAATLEYKDVKKYFLHEVDTYKIVFVDGVYSSFLSETTHQGIDVCLMSAALTKDMYKPIIEAYFNMVASKEENLTALNTAFSKEGAYIHIPKNTQAMKPIEIIHFATGREQALLLQPRNLVVVEENAEVQILERHQSLSENAVFTNAVTEIFAAKSAIIDFYKVQNDNNSASLVDNTYIYQHSKSVVTLHTFSFVGKWPETI